MVCYRSIHLRTTEMSFLEKISAFFTLKTSDELRSAAYNQEQLDRNKKNEWMLYVNDLDYITNYMSNKYRGIHDNLVQAKNIIIKLLGDNLLCLLNEPILQNAVIDIKEDKKEGSIVLQWATGNEKDEMTIMGVAFANNGMFRLTCATKCVGFDSNVKGVYVSDWISSIDSLPDWFEEVLQLIKYTHASHIDKVNPLSKINLDNLIKAKVSELEPRSEANRMCSEIITWILHDEYQDLAYYPKISGSVVSDNDIFYAIHLFWKIQNKETLKLVVTKYHLQNLGFVEVRFDIDARHKIETVFKLDSEEEAKQVIIPNWFKEKLEYVKNPNLALTCN
jgi:hypothetical protein